MLPQKKPLTAVSSTNEFTSLEINVNPEEIFPTRDGYNNKIEASELFTFFTASIIREDVTFTR